MVVIINDIIFFVFVLFIVMMYIIFCIYSMGNNIMLIFSVSSLLKS